MFISPKDQLAKVHDWNTSRSWGFTKKDFRDAEAALGRQDWPSDRLTALVLVPYLASVGDTFEELWKVASEQQPSYRYSGELKSTPEYLRLLDDITHKPGLRWEAIDLGANWDVNTGVRPVDVRDANSAHAGVLASAAHSPEWVQAMDGTNVPFVWLPGYQAIVSGRKAWGNTPYLYWNHSGHQVQLGAYLSSTRDWFWASPVVRAVLN